MKLLDDYSKTQESIYNYFGFKEGCKVYPIEDNRKYFWTIDSINVTSYDSIEAYKTGDGMQTYSDKILYLSGYPKAVYEGKEYTLIMIDTHTDGNKFLAIFDNSKQIK